MGQEGAIRHPEQIIRHPYPEQSEGEGSVNLRLYDQILRRDPPKVDTPPADANALAGTQNDNISHPEHSEGSQRFTINNPFSDLRKVLEGTSERHCEDPERAQRAKGDEAIQSEYLTAGIGAWLGVRWKAFIKWITMDAARDRVPKQALTEADIRTILKQFVDAIFERPPRTEFTDLRSTMPNPDQPQADFPARPLEFEVPRVDGMGEKHPLEVPIERPGMFTFAPNDEALVPEGPTQPLPDEHLREGLADDLSRVSESQATEIVERLARRWTSLSQDQQAEALAPFEGGSIEEWARQELRVMLSSEGAADGQGVLVRGRPRDDDRDRAGRSGTERGVKSAADALADGVKRTAESARKGRK